GQPLTAVLAAGPSDGTLTLRADGSFVYTPDPNFFGTDAFQYVVNNGQIDSERAFAVIEVVPPPVAQDDLYGEVLPGTTLTVAAKGVLANDADGVGSPLTARLVAGPLHGQVTLNTDGSFTYTAGADYPGTDHFTYVASNGLADSNVATVSLTHSVLVTL